MPTKAKSKRKVARKTASRSKPKAAKATKRAPSGPSQKQQFLDSFTKEHATTLKVLHAFPADQSEFRPHPRSRSARELAFTFVLEQMLISRALTNTLTLGAGAPPVPTGDFHGIISQFADDHADLVSLIRKTPENDFNTTVKFYSGPGQLTDYPKLMFAWFMLSDQIHHRGQLSVYLRMAGGKVPSIYGPSADEPWR